MSEPEENVSRHSATDAEKCREMETRYGWDLTAVEETPEDPIFKVDCVFDGETVFPNYGDDSTIYED
jgi:hypothetical protein